MVKGSKDRLDWSTLPSVSDAEAASSGRRIEWPALVVLWSRDEPARMGEVLLLPHGDPQPWIFGRGEGGERRLSLVRQRPGTRVPTGPLACPRISRAQLRLSPTPGGGIVVENIGRCALHLRGDRVARALLAPGDVFSLHNEVLFLCTRRPTNMPGGEHELGEPLHPFGGPDTFGFVGESPAAWDLRHRIAAVARQAFHVAILGPSGCGKEIVAQAIHARSARSGKPMVSRNAATIPEGLADAELFGNIRNYPNPGMPERAGLAGQAHESTLFLDEFAELPQSLQAHLLRLMDDGEYHRLGEATARKAHLRILAATNRPESDLRSDVLARLKVRIALPGLEARRDDIPLLAVHLIRKYAATDPAALARFFPDGDAAAMPRLSPILVETLVSHPYATHVRELDALLIRAIFESRGGYVSFRREARGDAPGVSPAHPEPDVPSWTADERSRLERLRQNRFSPTACGRDASYPGNRQTADLHLRQLICRALEIAEWNADRAADLLAGDSEGDLRDKGASRIATFLSNLRARVASESEEEIHRALAEEWKGNADLVHRLVEALRRGAVTP
jgi:two-component system nitrogen regulation response regulator GlnG/two-component system response regulator HydG